MLHWRLILGVLFVTVIAVLAYFDFGSKHPGLVMAPLAIGATWLAAGELVRLFEQDSQIPAPSRYLVVPGAVATVIASCAPMAWSVAERAPMAITSGVVGRVGWVAIGLAASSLVALCAEMLRYRTPGSATTRLALAIFAIAYAGGLMGFVVQLRLLRGGPWGEDGRWGMLALVSLILVVKASDSGAYVVGRLIGRTKMAPVLSPGKTWEGAAGGFVFATIATLITFGPLAAALGCEIDRNFPSWFVGCLLYALLVGAAGVAGDLAVSLLKRDAYTKHSSTWMPGFGGVLDLLDSILFAAPVAFLLWIGRLVGP
ncbi:phosphatidate cytidylyltransferase [Botrimarina sp.]|uniref:phosphatidate cytidylyltransferase n=1 Tax=Botrimarina sp. TaxID=2795802 RepID=UPI0032ECABB8